MTEESLRDFIAATVAAVCIFALLFAVFNMGFHSGFNKGAIAYANGTHVVQKNLDGTQTVFSKSVIKVIP